MSGKWKTKKMNIIQVNEYDVCILHIDIDLSSNIIFQFKLIITEKEGKDWYASIKGNEFLLCFKLLFNRLIINE